MSERVIKFRVYSKEHNHMIRDIAGIIFYKSKGIIEIQHDPFGFTKHDEKALEVMQFTGFTDTNGKELYEGDIIGDWYEVDGDKVLSAIPILWIDKRGAWCADLSYVKNGETLELLSEELDLYKYEHRGNIYEDPELLTPSTPNS